MPRRKRSRRRPRTSAKTSESSWFDWFGGIVLASGVADYKYGSIEGLSDKDRPFAGTHVACTVVTTSAAGACCMIDVYDDTGHVPIMTSGPQLIGQIPRNINLRVLSPKWWHVPSDPNLIVVRVHSITQSKDDKAQFRFVCKVHFRVGQEQFRGINHAALAISSTSAPELSLEDLTI